MEQLPNLVFLVFLLGLFYFMLIRPQRKRVESHRQLLESTRVGDEIVTIGGMHGTVRRMGEDEVEVEIAPGTVVRLVKSAIARRLVEDDVDDVEEIGDTGEENA